eukprot:6178036-Pleurochrysis_carterae.AAC.1
MDRRIKLHPACLTFSSQEADTSFSLRTILIAPCQIATDGMVSKPFSAWQLDSSTSSMPILRALDGLAFWHWLVLGLELLDPLCRVVDADGVDLGGEDQVGQREAADCVRTQIDTYGAPA